MPEPVRDFADKIMREALQAPANLRDLLRARVPDLADGFDFDHVHSIPSQFLVPDGRGREADLLFEIPWRRGAIEKLALVCVLLEHQTNPDPRMPLRTLLYVVLYWEKKWAEWESLPAPRSEFRLPPVLPIVVHTGTRPWGSPRTIAELLGEPDEFKAFAPQWSPLFWELPLQSVDELLSADNALLNALAVVRVENAERAEFERILRESWRRLDRLHADNTERWSFLIRLTIGWIVHRRPAKDRAEMLHVAQDLANERDRPKEMKEMIQTIADLNFAEGELKGRTVQARSTIFRLGKRHLGPVAPEVESALNAIDDLDRLEMLTERVLEIKNWSELLATP